MASSYDGLKEYVVVFVYHRMYFNMRFQELEALASMFGVTSKKTLYVDDPPPSALSESPIVRVRLPADEARVREMCQRAVLVKLVIDVWGTGGSVNAAVEMACAVDETSLSLRREMMAPPRTFMIRVAKFGTSAKADEKRRVMDVMNPLFRGDEPCDLRNPDNVIWAVEEVAHLSQLNACNSQPRADPLLVLVGRQVAGGRSTDKSTHGEHAFFHVYNLSKRAVLGPATMDNELAFIMANCACARLGSIAMDPFCGTGGILVALSHFRAHVVGSELDRRVIYGSGIAHVNNAQAMQAVTQHRMQHASDGDTLSRNIAEHGDECLENTDIFVNFQQYELPLPEIVLCHNGTLPWRAINCGWLDCLVTDPPYGIRVASKQRQDSVHAALPMSDGSDTVYQTNALQHDVLDFAAVSLRDNARLVFLVPIDLADLLVEHGENNKSLGVGMPETLRAAKAKNKLRISEVTRDERLLDEGKYEKFVPQHACLETVGSSLQVLSAGLGRLLVTMRRRPRLQS
eukprot:TRINITY_DN33905_c0_g1_i1.p1 TRINITY_DN33905_c0_g1~~TRINITY_DN33905_c0_g1_i1.p1  ORF type:complete len:515 (+),score=55.51 TRINITY_DN33905_c0_g1_i1:118-1662(+)